MDVLSSSAAKAHVELVPHLRCGGGRIWPIPQLKCKARPENCRLVETWLAGDVEDIARSSTLKTPPTGPCRVYNVCGGRVVLARPVETLRHCYRLDNIAPFGLERDDI